MERASRRLRALRASWWIPAALCWAWASPAHAEPNDAAALDLVQKAIGTDYLSTDFAAAEKKLRQALKLCAKGKCSKKVTAHVHRDLGLVLVVAKKGDDDAKGQFVLALQDDPDVQLEPDLASPDVRAVFDDAKKSLSGEPAAEAPATEPAPSAAEASPAAEPTRADRPLVGPEASDCPPGLPGCPSKTPDRADDGAANKKRTSNWITLSVQQDLLFVGSSMHACSESSDYACFDDSDAYYDKNPYEEQGGEISGGLNPATTRLMLGYDRAVTGGLSLGARVGFAFRGGPTTPGGAAFLPLHAEGRLAYYFGGFAPRRGPRLFIAGGGGVAQVDGRVPVVVYQSEQDFRADKRTTYSAWRKTGTGFAALGAGMLIAVTPDSGAVAELRLMEMFGISATVLAPQLGYAVGF